MRRMKILTTLLILCISLFSCKNTDGLTVGFLMESFSSARWAMDKKYFEEKITESNGKVITKLSDGNDITQFNQAIELMDEGADVIVIVAANVNSAAAIVREAHARNIKVIAYDRLVKNCELDYFVGFDAKQIGFLQASYVLDKKPNGNFILIEGDNSDINAVNIELGQKEALSDKIKNGQINIIYQAFIKGWSPSEAQFEVEKVLNLSDKPIDAIIAANDGTASGAINALQKYGLDNDVIITGLDAELAACKRINNGTQTMTVYTPIKQLAQTAATLALEVAQNKKSSFTFSGRNNGRVDVPAIILESIALDKSNLNLIIEDGIYKKEDIQK